MHISSCNGAVSQARSRWQRASLSSRSLTGKKLLCLAAGGGRQGPLYAAAGANVTVVDISAAQLELDREIAADRRLHLRTVQTSMDDLSMFAAGEFDVVIQPVSTCYVSEVRRTYAAVAQVTRTGGIYVSQHKQPASLQASTLPSKSGYELTEPYYREGPLPPVCGSLHREEGTLSADFAAPHARLAPRTTSPSAPDEPGASA